MRAHALHALLLLATTLAGAGAFALPQDPPPAAAGPGKASGEQDGQEQQDQETRPEPPAPDPPPRQGGGAPPSDDAFKMGSPAALPEGVTQEEMWPAATAEGWKKPGLIHWQRSFDDALRVARAENRPILVAVNMDGEIASEHFAGVRYRDPETAEMMSRYVCVIASVYRHTPRDYDEEGHRIECPRFGTVTCGEHLEAERELYETYFDGQRVSPRHIVIDLEGKESWDVYYSWDTATVFTTFRKGIEGWPEPNPPPEPTIENLARNADVRAREFLERTYAEGTREEKLEVLRVLRTEHVVDQVEVLRTAIFGFDVELARFARQALAKCDTEPALDLIAEALKVPLEPEERASLLAAVNRMGEHSTRAHTLAALHSGLSVESRHIDARSARELAKEYEANAGLGVDVQERADAAEARPDDPAALLEFAVALLARAEQARQSRYARLFAQDAHDTALEAEGLGASGPRLDAVVAAAALVLGDRETARTRAVAAIEGGLLQAPENTTPGAAPEVDELSKERVLWSFAEARRRAIRDAYRAGEDWPPEWLSDLNAAFSVLAEGPLADEEIFASHCDFLRWIGATPRANAALDDGLRRFPDSRLLHERLRGRLLWEGGPEGLERGYAERLEREQASGDSPSQLTWFAGYASLVAAEHHRRRKEFEAAGKCYGRGIAYYEQNIELFPEGRDLCEHFIALARAGLSRLALERGELDVATDELIAALELQPESAATQDGLGISPVATALMLKARLVEAGDTERAARVQTALATLDPALLEPPPSEQRVDRGRRGRRDRGGGR